MARIRIRHGDVDDLDTLVRHRRGMFEEMGVRDDAALDSHDRRYRRWVRTRLRNGSVVAYVAQTGSGKMVASGCVWIRSIQPSPHGSSLREPYLMSMFTEPAFRRQGLGARIVRRALADMRSRRFRLMWLHASTTGRKMYPALGFERTWEMRAWLKGPPRTLGRRRDCR